MKTRHVVFKVPAGKARLLGDCSVRGRTEALQFSYSDDAGKFSRLATMRIPPLLLPPAEGGRPEADFVQNSLGNGVPITISSNAEAIDKLSTK
jgi:hypothetical protein